MARDKKLHMAVGFVISVCVALFCAVIGFSILACIGSAFGSALAAGVAREIANALGIFGVAKTGFDVADIIATAAGSFPVVIVGVLLS